MFIDNHVTRRSGRLAALFFFLVPVTPMAAQHSPPPGFGKDKTPVVVAVVEKLKDQKDAEVVVIRRANLIPHDVILVSKNRVNAEWLAEAVWTLQVARSVDGNIPTTDVTYRIAMREGSADRKDLKEYAKDWAQALKNDPGVRPIAGIGDLPQMELYLPNKLPKMKIVPIPE